jgi:hypothetical protein
MRLPTTTGDYPGVDRAVLRVRPRSILRVRINLLGMARSS